jgi:hypothetical protein
MLILNKYYNLTTYSSIIFGADLKNLKLVSIFDYSTALKFSNIVMLQKQVLPYLPPGTPLDDTKYIYYKFLDSNGKEYIIADTWIVPSSIVLVDQISLIVKVNNITNADIPLIRDQLRTLGYTFEISQV